MEFGRVDERQLGNVNFRLPPDPAANDLVLPGTPASTTVWLGNAKWGRREWVGKLYPPKTPERRFLSEYVRFYNSIELNATHYKLYGPAGIAAWSAVAGDKPFLFCPKMYQGITHRGKLDGKTFLIQEFLRGVQAFEAHLGPIFLQFPEQFGPGRAQELFQWLRQLPRGFRFFVEVRHPGWFRDGDAWESLTRELTAAGIGLVITDTAGRRDCCHMQLTIPETFIRFVGNSLHPTDYARCDTWVARIKTWQAKGLQQLYFFMHMHDETYSPELSVYLAGQLNKVLKIPVQVPEVHPELAVGKAAPRGINQRFSAGLEAAIQRREARGKTKGAAPAQRNALSPPAKNSTKKTPAQKTAVKKPGKAAPKKSRPKKASVTTSGKPAAAAKAAKKATAKTAAKKTGKKTPAGSTVRSKPPGGATPA